MEFPFRNETRSVQSVVLEFSSLLFIYFITFAFLKIWKKKKNPPWIVCAGKQSHIRYWKKKSSYDFNHKVKWQERGILFSGSASFPPGGAIQMYPRYLYLILHFCARSLCCVHEMIHLFFLKKVQFFVTKTKSKSAFKPIFSFVSAAVASHRHLKTNECREGRYYLEAICRDWQNYIFCRDWNNSMSLPTCLGERGRC